MKLLLLFSLFLGSTFSFAASRAPMIIVGEKSEILVFTKTSKLPYNMFFVEGAACYFGKDEDVAEIVERAIKNHHFGAKELVIKGLSREYDPTRKKEFVVVVEVENTVKKSDSFRLAFKPCSTR